MQPQKLDPLLNQLLADLGGAFGIPLVRIGLEMDLYATLSHKGPLTSQQLARETGLAERYLREWLSYNAASNYVSYDPATRCFAMTPEQAALLADRDSPTFIADAFNAAAAYLDNQPAVQDAFRTGKGVGWGDQSHCLACAVARFFRPGYQANLVSQWLPALDGVVEKLDRGARVADVGCGHGYSTLIMAQAFPNSEFIGFDFHQESIREARDHARAHGAPQRLSYQLATATDFPGQDFDLVTTFDALHDMGDPVGVAAHACRALKHNGTWLIVEPFAHDRLEDNLNPVSRLYYAASTMVCVPTSLSQDVGSALGAQAGEARLREVVTRGGFRTLTRAAETPFNLILEQPGANAPVFTINMAGTGARTRIVCGYLAGEHLRANPLILGLPPVLRIDMSDAGTGRWVRSTFEYAADQIASGHRASATVLAKVSELLLVEAVGRYVESQPETQTGWIAALRDPYVSRALGLLHGRLDRRWTVERLGREVGLSRSALAQRFRDLLGRPPMQYLALRRIQVAAQELRASNKTLLRIAQEVGYDSEAAFSRAFKRIMGSPPARWRVNDGSPSSRGIAAVQSRRFGQKCRHAGHEKRLPLTS